MGVVIGENWRDPFRHDVAVGVLVTDLLGSDGPHLDAAGSRYPTAQSMWDRWTPPITDEERGT